MKFLKDKIQASSLLKNQVTKTLKSKCLAKSRGLTCTYLEGLLQTNFFKQRFKRKQFKTCESCISYCILQYVGSMLLIQCNLNDYFT